MPKANFASLLYEYNMAQERSQFEAAKIALSGFFQSQISIFQDFGLQKVFIQVKFDSSLCLMSA